MNNYIYVIIMKQFVRINNSIIYPKRFFFPKKKMNFEIKNSRKNFRDSQFLKKQPR